MDGAASEPEPVVTLNLNAAALAAKAGVFQAISLNSAVSTFSAKSVEAFGFAMSRMAWRIL